MGRRRPQATRHGRARRLRDRAEDRRARDQPHLRGRPVHAGCDARRRCPGRGRHRQHPDDPVRPAADAGRPPALAARGARRGLSADLRLPGAERAHCRARAEAGAQPAQRRRRLAPPEGLVDHRLAAARRVGLRDRLGRRSAARVAMGDPAVAARARLPHESVRGATGDDRGGRGSLHGVGEAPDRARLRDRRDRDQGRLPRPAAPPRRAALEAALVAGVQVGADDGADEAARDPDPGRADGRAQPVGGAGAGRGRRRHRLARDSAQRGRHQPQGDPRGRRRDRPACRAT